MADDPIVIERQGAVATVVLSRPEAMNALDDGMRQGLAAALSTVEHDPAIRALVITGSGPSFCAGGDIHHMMELKRNHQSVAFRNYLEAGHALVKKIRELPKPVVASINGPAAGAGLNLALACDLRIASDRATFTQNFIQLGLHPDWGGTFSLPRFIGVGRALEMFLLGGFVNAAQAEEWGLVNRVVPDVHLADETRKLAGRLADAPPLPIALLKQALYQRLETQLDLMMDFEVAAQMKCFDSEDFTEGLAAFLENRRPDFKGV